MNKILPQKRWTRNNFFPIAGALVLFLVFLFSFGMGKKAMAAGVGNVDINQIDKVLIDKTITAEDGTVTKIGSDENTTEAIYGQTVTLKGRLDNDIDYDNDNLYSNVIMYYMWYFLPSTAKPGTVATALSDRVVGNSNVTLSLTDCVEESGQYFLEVSSVSFGGSGRSFSPVLKSNVVTVTISPKELTVEYGETETVYNGKTQEVPYTLIGEVEGKPCESFVDMDSIPLDCGTYHVKGIVTNNTNYCFSADTSTDFTVKKAILLVNVDDISVLSGYSYQEYLKISYSGFVEGEDADIVFGTEQPTFSDALLGNTECYAQKTAYTDGGGTLRTEFCDCNVFYQFYQNNDKSKVDTYENEEINKEKSALLDQVGNDFDALSQKSSGFSANKEDWQAEYNTFFSDMQKLFLAVNGSFAKKAKYDLSGSILFTLDNFFAFSDENAKNADTIKDTVSNLFGLYNFNILKTTAQKVMKGFADTEGIADENNRVKADGAYYSPEKGYFILPYAVKCGKEKVYLCAFINRDCNKIAFWVSDVATLNIVREGGKDGITTLGRCSLFDIQPYSEPGEYEIFANGVFETKNYDVRYGRATLHINLSTLSGDKISDFDGTASGSFSFDAHLSVMEEDPTSVVSNGFKLWETPAHAYRFVLNGESHLDSFTIHMNNVELTDIFMQICFVSSDGTVREKLTSYDYDGETLSVELQQTDGYIVVYYNLLWVIVPAGVLLIIALALIIFHVRDRKKTKVNRLNYGAAKVEADKYRELIGKYVDEENRKV